MTTLKLKLFGNPAIFLDDKEIFFSFSKLNALLYYLLINETVARDEIAGILWEDKDNQKAKKNLRNTIYQVNKKLGADYIICPNRSMLTLNPQLSITCDAKQFLAEPKKNSQLYQGEFLQGFYLKSNESFDLWQSKMRAHFEQLFIQSSYQQIEEMKESAPFDDLKAIIDRLISIDEFEEKNYQLLMELYQKHGHFGKVIETYYQLANLLDKELGISPSEKTQHIYAQVIARDRNQRKIKAFLGTNNLFFGRVSEIKALERFFTHILSKGHSHTLLLEGDSGIGKRTVTRQVLANQTQNYQIITSECFRENTSQDFALWPDILEALGDLILQQELMTSRQWQTILELYLSPYQESIEKDDHTKLANFISDVLKKIAQHKATIILIEDIHWITPKSLAILKTVINHLKEYPLAVVLTKNLMTSPYLEDFLNQLIYQGKLDKLSLRALSKKESLNYLSKRLEHLSLSEKDYETFYQFSQGNFFFLSEYAELLLQGKKFTPLTSAIKANYALKLSSINHFEEEILHYLASFKKAMPITILAKLMSLSLEELISILESLCQKGILFEEDDHDDILVQFRQKALTYYIYDSLSLAKKRLLHVQIAQQLEESKEIFKDYSQAIEDIAYHYQLAKQPLKALHYYINALELNLEFQHQLFPIYSQSWVPDQGHNYDSYKNIQEQLASVEKQLQDNKKAYQKQKDFQKLLMRFLYLKGCYQIRIGNYQKGISNIQQLIGLAGQDQDASYLLEAYRQLIYYCIQVENLPEMHYYTELALEASAQANNHEAIALNLRLSGLYQLMIGQVKEARKLINESINCFSLTSGLRKKYAIQIAAGLDYLAEIEQMQGSFDKAKNYQKQAIELSKNSLSEPSIISFYIGLGISYFYLQNYDKAEQIFLDCEKNLESLSFPWKEVQLEVYLTLIKCQKENYQPLINLLHKKETLIQRYSNPRDKGMIYYIMAYTKFALLSEKIHCQELAQLLPQDFNHYYHIAKLHLNPYRDCRLLMELEHCQNLLYQNYNH
ncbi:AAA family ATPase [Streptococcus didelphis]|uniref:AAA family ATPase n=1 Tax=Streptococcus didelphis TaxID=102886 RepID=UPI00035E9043|nr:AAA family ATPase [Streptococcus didelphis]